ncbi:exported protein of unknown function [Nitrospira moscoviensis]|uniref:Uncharacterized protein n=1 Tax=Nitrospira moscoviensis TaxID=42253 RepID=A0A0K2GEP8_NITMO|nr:exported protein of unknown function [Nitrospira moscoviensis]
MSKIGKTKRLQHIRPSHFFMIVGLMALGIPAISGTAASSEIDRQVACGAAETTELNRWPLRTQDMPGCAGLRQGQVLLQTTRSRREAEEPALNRWPYAFKATEIESDKALVVEDTRDRSKISERTEPDLNMWPLWPKS